MFPVSQSSFRCFRLGRTQSPDLILLDISLPDKYGLELLNDFRAQKPGLPIMGEPAFAGPWLATRPALAFYFKRHFRTEAIRLRPGEGRS
jgi:hypothetical protein